MHLVFHCRIRSFSWSSALWLGQATYRIGMLTRDIQQVIHKIYNKYEIPPSDFPGTILLLVGIPTVPCYFVVVNVGSKVLAISLSYAVFYTALASSIILYRISPLHPLAGYPGPFLFKLSKFVGMYHASRGKQHTLFKALHDKYGPIVRVG